MGETQLGLDFSFSDLYPTLYKRDHVFSWDKASGSRDYVHAAHQRQALSEARTQCVCVCLFTTRKSDFVLFHFVWKQATNQSGGLRASMMEEGTWEGIGHPFSCSRLDKVLLGAGDCLVKDRESWNNLLHK